MWYPQRFIRDCIVALEIRGECQSLTDDQIEKITSIWDDEALKRGLCNNYTCRNENGRCVVATKI